MNKMKFDLLDFWIIVASFVFGLLIEFEYYGPASSWIMVIILENLYGFKSREGKNF